MPESDARSVTVTQITGDGDGRLEGGCVVGGEGGCGGGGGGGGQVR